jgi:hypothetical protein
MDEISNFDKNVSYSNDTTSRISVMVEAEERHLAENKTNNKVLKSDEVFNLMQNYLENKLVEHVAAFPIGYHQKERS